MPGGRPTVWGHPASAHPAGLLMGPSLHSDHPRPFAVSKLQASISCVPLPRRFFFVVSASRSPLPAHPLSENTVYHIIGCLWSIALFPGWIGCSWNRHKVAMGTAEFPALNTRGLNDYVLSGQGHYWRSQVKEEFLEQGQEARPLFGPEGQERQRHCTKPRQGILSETVPCQGPWLLLRSIPMFLEPGLVLSPTLPFLYCVTLSILLSLSESHILLYKMEMAVPSLNGSEVQIMVTDHVYKTLNTVVCSQ